MIKESERVCVHLQCWARATSWTPRAFCRGRESGSTCNLEAHAGAAAYRHVFKSLSDTHTRMCCRHAGYGNAPVEPGDQLVRVDGHGVEFGGLKSLQHLLGQKRATPANVPADPAESCNRRSPVRAVERARGGRARGGARPEPSWGWRLAASAC